MRGGEHSGQGGGTGGGVKWFNSEHLSKLDKKGNTKQLTHVSHSCSENGGWDQNLHLLQDPGVCCDPANISLMKRNKRGCHLFIEKWEWDGVKARVSLRLENNNW